MYKDIGIYIYIRTYMYVYITVCYLFICYLLILHAVTSRLYQYTNVISFKLLCHKGCNKMECHIWSEIFITTFFRAFFAEYKVWCTSISTHTHIYICIYVNMELYFGAHSVLKCIWVSFKRLLCYSFIISIIN